MLYFLTWNMATETKPSIFLQGKLGRRETCMGSYVANMNNLIHQLASVVSMDMKVYGENWTGLNVLFKLISLAISRLK